MDVLNFWRWKDAELIMTDRERHTGEQTHFPLFPCYVQTTPSNQYGIFPAPCDSFILFHSLLIGGISFCFVASTRCCQKTEARLLASAVSRAGVLPGEVVSVLVPNVPLGITCHFAIPGMGATLHMINTRLDASTVAFQVSGKKKGDLVRYKQYHCNISRTREITMVVSTVLGAISRAGTAVVSGVVR